MQIPRFPERIRRDPRIQAQMFAIILVDLTQCNREIPESGPKAVGFVVLENPDRCIWGKQSDKFGNWESSMA